MMKINNFGKVTISENEIKIEDWEVDFDEEDSIHMNYFSEWATIWAIKRLMNTDVETDGTTPD